MENEFFDQETGIDEEVDMMEDSAPETGASLLINGSHLPLEVGSNFLQSVKSAALQAGFGKFKVLLNGVEVRPSNCPETVEPDHRVELRPYDEAG